MLRVKPYFFIKKNNSRGHQKNTLPCLLYTSDAADERSSVDLGGRRIIKKKKKKHNRESRNNKKKTRTEEQVRKTRIDDSQIQTNI